ncbi:Protein CROWDED NUCLEI 1 [Abeliophyllum distichum]|uniref:Protein CROWDED NUCLEI 1 n=1 Tax=Abeliophyllum distichum TaxID=126358 RepID=A0ABD1V3R5_9LAMI
MFTPQKKLWSLTPRSEPAQKNGSVSGPGSGPNPNPRSPMNGEIKGKAAAFADNIGAMDKDSLTDKLLKLENELFDYQYNMGLLLIEKKEWTSKHEELRQALAEANDVLKREQVANSIAMSEVEKREENLKKALGVERQCVLDLEKALHEIRSDNAAIKFTADSKLAEANALVTSVEEKSLGEIERKLHEVEAQENSIRRERAFFISEREAHETALSKQREDLREWEQKLKEGEDRLADGRRLLNQREERANENDNVLKKKQSDLEELQKRIEMANSVLKSKEDDMSSRLASLALKEKEADDIRKSLETKEKQLLELEEKLNAKEKVEIQKLLDEHKTILGAKQEAFDLEMDQKRKSLDEELKGKVAEVEKKEAEITHMEEKLRKREQALEKKSEKIREKEMDFESKSKALKEREKSLKIEEKSLEKERKQMMAEKENMLNLKTELEKVRDDIEKEQMKLREEREQLKVTNEDRLEHARLQSELKQEIDKCRLQSEQLLKEAEDLKYERERFEKEWEELDNKRAEIGKELEDVIEQKKYVEKLKHSEEERLNSEKLETQKYVQRELEALKVAKDSFNASMEHEKSILTEKTDSERTQLLHDFELQKRELETEMQRKQEEMENRLRESEISFVEEKERELNNINYLREVARREMEEMKLERVRLEKEKLEVSQNKKHVESQQCEMKKDIEELVDLSWKLKDQREQFIKERERFIVFAEKQKSCNICGETIHEFMLSDLRSLAELENVEAPPLPRAAENYLKESIEGPSQLSPVLVNSASPPSGGTMSWFRKCTSKIFKLSPAKKLELGSSGDPANPITLPGEHVDAQSPKTLPNTENEPEPSLLVANDSFDVQISQYDGSIREVEDGQDLLVDQRNVDSVLAIPENSQNSDAKTRRRGPGKGGKPRVIRTRSVKAASAGANNAILGETPQENDSQRDNGSSKNPLYLDYNSQAESDLLGAEKPRNGRKRNRVNVSQATASEDGHGDGHSDSVGDGDRKKRRQKVAAAGQSFGEKRYNLRRSKISVATESNGPLPEPSKGKKKSVAGVRSQREELPSSKVREEIHDPEAAASTLPIGFGGGGDSVPIRSTEAASEFSADSPIRFENDGAGRHHVKYTANTSLDDMVMSEEVNGTEGARDYSDEELRTETREEDDDDNDDGDDDEVDHPGEASISKKLWTFLTT